MAKLLYRYEISVFGVVQGVGMRYFIKNLADANALVGWTKNQMDGSVKVIVEGTEEVNNIFCDKLKLGNGISKITSISVNKTLISKYSFSCFEIEP